MTATEAPALATAPVPCQPWCCYGDGHPDQKFAEDQMCWGEILAVPMTRELLIAWTDGSGTSYMAPDEWQVYAQQRVLDDAEPTIVIDREGCLSGPCMTIAEAQQLIEALQLVIGQVKM